MNTSHKPSLGANIRSGRQIAKYEVIKVFI